MMSCSTNVCFAVTMKLKAADFIIHRFYFMNFVLLNFIYNSEILFKAQSLDFGLLAVCASGRAHTVCLNCKLVLIYPLRSAMFLCSKCVSGFSLKMTIR